MSRHNYTNPAFSQQDEYYRPPSAQPASSPARVHRSESSRSFHLNSQYNRSLRNIASPRSIQVTQKSNTGLNCSHHQQHQPPKPGPKPMHGLSAIPTPQGSRYGSVSDVQSQSSSGRYALVPVEELGNNNKGRYAVLPAQAASRFVKSQENLDRFLDGEEEELPHNFSDQAFSSLPPISPQHEIPGPGRLVPAFSTDFASKSFVLYDQKSQQRYAVVPTEENEEIVDDNHEIIQMHNGRPHRYAVIPTEEEETCLNGEINPPYAPINSRRVSPQRTPQKVQQMKQTLLMHQQQIITPKKNPLATQKLHELLSTPQKQFVRQNSIPLTPRNSPYRINKIHASNPRLVSSTPNSTPNREWREIQSRGEFTPQKLQYDQRLRMASTTTLNLNMDQRTTAIIQPRIAASIYGETTTSTATEKSWEENQNYKSHQNATKTIAAVSLMIMLSGFLNSGLCLYMTSVSSTLNLYTGRSYFLDFGLISGFAAIALGFLGFRSRKSDWFPNRNYVSGYILVTVFSLLFCCSLIVLLITKPKKGSPLHDVTTGIALGLSSLTVILISLGVIASRLCRAPPPDNRVDVS